MTPDEMFDEAVKIVLKQKSAAVAKGWAESDDDVDINPVLVGYRKEEPVVLMIPASMERNEQMKTMFIGFQHFSCDTIVYCNEGWVGAQGHINPRTGEMYLQGELEEAVTKHDGLNTGEVTECINTVLVGRDGTVIGGMNHFKVNKATEPWTLEWGDVHKADSQDYEGAIVDAMKQYAAGESLWEQAIREAPKDALEDMTVEQLITHMDCSIVKFGLDHMHWEGACALIADGGEREEIIRRSLKDKILTSDEINERRDGNN